MAVHVPKSVLLTVPGWNGSGPRHWQTIWESGYGGFRRVEQREWERPIRGEWTDSIDRAVREAEASVYIVAHSLGCVAVAHWAAERGGKLVRAAMLVAPPWLTSTEACPEALRSFLPMPLGRLPFPSTVVASENDPYIGIEAAARLAESWGADFVNAGRLGHINADSGHGPWPEGKRLLAAILEAQQPARRVRPSLDPTRR